MMGDLVHQDAGHEPCEVFAAIHPFNEDGIAIQYHAVRKLNRIGYAALCHRYAAIQAGQLPGIVQAECFEGFLIGEVFHDDRDPAGLQVRRQCLVGCFGEGEDVFFGGRRGVDFVIPLKEPEHADSIDEDAT